MKKVSIVLIALALITLFSCNVEGVTKPESNTTLPINKEQFTGDLTWQLQVTSISDLVTLPSQDGSFTWKEIKDLSNDEKNILLENLTSGYWKIEVRGRDLKSNEIVKEGSFIIAFNENQSFKDLSPIKIEIQEHKHNLDSVDSWHYNKEFHYHICLTCGEEVDKAEHQWHSNEDNTLLTCSICGAEKDIQDHTHDYSVWAYDDIYHWKKCSLCGDIDEKSKEEHSALELTYRYDSSNKTLTISNECKECGYSDKGTPQPSDGMIDINQLQSPINMSVIPNQKSNTYTFSITNRKDPNSTLTWKINGEPLDSFNQGEITEPTGNQKTLIIALNTTEFENNLLLVECVEDWESKRYNHLVYIKFGNK